MDNSKKVTVQYDLSTAETEALIRNKLVELGWTPSKPCPIKDVVNSFEKSYTITACIYLDDSDDQEQTVNKEPKNNLQEILDILKDLTSAEALGILEQAREVKLKEFRRNYEE